MDVNGRVGDDEEDAYWGELDVLEELERMRLPGGLTHDGCATHTLCSRRESLQVVVSNTQLKQKSYKLMRSREKLFSPVLWPKASTKGVMPSLPF